ncbi:prolyl-tRNA synthetase [Candidatus Saccharibacteria bacterium]|nr:prolyl-tRNA synthetase [Candidatus Saccharibacteria bacterium]
MRVSQLITKTRKEAPADETAKNAQLLIRAGYVHKDAAGVYVWLPLGRKVLNNIIQIIRDEMDAIGGQEVVMSTLQRKEVWERTNRWDDEIVDVWFKTTYKNGTEAGLAWSHEEQMVDTFRQHIDSYKDLPKAAYQFQNKLRNETRAKSGIMRTREFIMKDMYSFARTEAEHKEFYDKVTAAYLRIFERLGIGESTYFTVASGGAFAEFSHEFQTICEAGEDVVYIDDEKHIAINEEVMRDDVLKNLGVQKDKLRKAKTAEVGNIFSFGTSKSEPYDFVYTDENGEQQFVVMGSYGIGPARVMGVIVEHMGDDQGIVWPTEIAPYQLHITSLGNDDAVIAEANKIYNNLISAGFSVIWDDRDVSAGEKFADADLMGMPYRVVVSKKTIDSEAYEVKVRKTGEVLQLNLDELKKLLAK